MNDKCPMCEGAGRIIDEEPCPQCKGTGLARRIFIKPTYLPALATDEEIKVIIKEAYEQTQAEQNNGAHS